MHLAWCSCCRNRNLRVRSEGHLTHSGTFDSMIIFFFFIMKAIIRILQIKYNEIALSPEIFIKGYYRDADLKC